MGFDKILREMIRDEVASAVAPLAAAIDRLEQNGNLAAQLGSLLGGVKRGPGRPRKTVVLGRAPGRPAKTTTAAKAGKTPCAVIGCKRPNRSKGYCAAHYQKYRMLVRTRRLPSDWAASAKPQSAKDVVLPRGRAGAKALAAAKAK